MGLNVIVGLLADIGDDEEAETFRAHFAIARELLAGAGAERWDEPDLDEEDVADYEMSGYGGLHALRRLAVHLERNASLPEPLGADGDATDDPLLAESYAACPRTPAGPFDHLVHHSDCEGYYVPVDFTPVLFDERLPGALLGSSVRLLAEARGVAAALGLPEDLDPDSEEVTDAYGAEASEGEGWRRYGVESRTCLQLISAAKHSMATGAAITFC